MYTNVTSDHLDRHGSIEAYRLVKRRLAELVDPDGALVLNAEDPVVAGYGDSATAPAVMYRDGSPVAGRPRRARRWIVAAGVERLPLAGGGTAATGPGGGIMPVAELAIPGRHNVSNALAAIAVGLLFGVAPEAIRRAAAAFTGVEHRLQPVALVDGVRFVNDSQGTQPDAVIAALRAFPPPVVLIAGGRDKGVDLTALAAVAAETVEAAVLIGESGPALEALLRDAGVPQAARADTLEDAVATADALARDALATRPAGTVATVLLSPAAASFDMFVDYAARGRAFIAAVGRLAEATMSTTPLTRGPSPRPASPRTQPRGPDHAPARAPRARVRDPRRDRRPRRHRDPDGLLVLGDEGVPPEATTRSRSSARRSSGPRSAMVAMVLMMRIDYRWLRVASVPLFIIGVASLLLVFVPADQHRRRRLGPLAQGRAAAGGPPGRVHEARPGRVPRPLVRQARDRGARVLGGDGAVPRDHGPRRRRSSCSSPTSAPRPCSRSRRSRCSSSRART